jgi:hypothetical protein
MDIPGERSVFEKAPLVFEDFRLQVVILGMERELVQLEI